MKRIEQLQNLSREHHQSLILAQQAIKASEANNAEVIAELCKEIVDEYPDVWNTHFNVEEDSIFRLFTESEAAKKCDDKVLTEITRLCHLLIQEHRTMDGYYEQLKKGNYQVLGEFGTLLKKHTRTEERELFPLLEDVMSTDELNTVLKISQASRKKSRSNS